jgi:hypothetical protein
MRKKHDSILERFAVRARENKNGVKSFYVVGSQGHHSGIKYATREAAVKAAKALTLHSLKQVEYFAMKWVEELDKKEIPTRSFT